MTNRFGYLWTIVAAITLCLVGPLALVYAYVWATVAIHHWAGIITLYDLLVAVSGLAIELASRGHWKPLQEAFLKSETVEDSRATHTDEAQKRESREKLR